MNILLAASELTPYARCGALGDVLEALPVALKGNDHSVSVVVPLYRTLKKNFRELKRTRLTLQVTLNGGRVPVPVWQGRTSKGVMVFALQRDEYFDRTELYEVDGKDYDDNAERYAFFSRAVSELALYVEPQLDIIHVHDWHTALVTAYIKAWSLPFKTVLSIHHLAYQGSFEGYKFSATELPPDYFSPEGIEFYGKVNFLKGGIRLADAVTTVSPSYAELIQQSMYGFGLHHVLEEKASKLTGIVHGIDTQLWNPKDDTWIASPYSVKEPAEREACRTELIKLAKLKVKPLLIGIQSRFARVKGTDFLIRSAERLLKLDVSLIIMGDGEVEYLEPLQELAKKYSKQVFLKVGYDERLDHKMMAGCDVMFIPSEVEPHSEVALRALRYGAIPLLHHTCGLADVVIEWDGEEGCGFQFRDYTTEALLAKVEEIQNVRADKKAWQHLVKNAMSADFSWEATAEQYEALYRKVLAK